MTPTRTATPNPTTTIAESGHPDPLLRPGDVAALFDVNLKTVRRWARHGQLRPAVRTPGGHHRYRQSDIEQLLDRHTETRPAA